MAEEIVEGNTLEAGTELDEAAKFWGNELALENGEELPENEDNQLMSGSEEEPDQEEVQERYEEDEEEESEEQLFEVKSDGETKSATLQELKDNWSKGENYTQKSQSLAEERKAFEQEQVESRQMREQAIFILETAKAQTQPEQHDDAYWQNLKDSDPMQWMMERDALREGQMQEHQRSLQLDQLKAQESAERHEEKEQYISSQRDTLKTLVPEWDDEKTADAEKKLVLEWASTIGKYTPEELDKTYDARAVAVMRKAMLYDQLEGKRKSLKPVKHQNMRAGSQSGEPSKIKAGKAAQRLQKSGSLDDAAGVFYNMIRSK